MHIITTTIKPEFLRQIVAGEKQIEYRDIKSYWIRRFNGVKPPFLLRLINGMQANAPEVTVVIQKIRENTGSGYFELAIGRIVQVKHWNRKLERPIR